VAGAIVLFLLSNIFGVALFALVEFPESRPVFMAEYLTDHYSVSSYFISKLTVDALVVLPIVASMVRTYESLRVTRMGIVDGNSILSFYLTLLYMNFGILGRHRLLHGGISDELLGTFRCNLCSRYSFHGYWCACGLHVPPARACPRVPPVDCATAGCFVGIVCCSPSDTWLD